MCIPHLFMDAKKQLPFQSIFRYHLCYWNLWQLLKSEVKPMGQASLQMFPAWKGCLPMSAAHGWFGAKPLQGFLSSRKGIEKGPLVYLWLGDTYIYLYMHAHTHIYTYIYVQGGSPPATRLRYLVCSVAAPRSQSPQLLALGYTSSCLPLCPCAPLSLWK